MNAQELFIAGGKSAGVFYCGVCEVVHKTLELAEACCKPLVCVRCGSPTGRYRLKCDKCQLDDIAEKEKARFDKAEKITKHSGDPVFCGDDFYQDEETLLDDLSPNDYPEYVWAAKEEYFVKLDAERIIDSVAEDAYEDFDISDLNGVEEFKAAVAAFNAANHNHFSYVPDYTRAILIEKGE